MNNEVDELNNTIFNRLEIKSLKAHPKLIADLLEQTTEYPSFFTMKIENSCFVRLVFFFKSILSAKSKTQSI